MKLFWKNLASVLFYVISGALLIYAAARSLDFITSTLPPEQQAIGYLGLAATSGGMIAWLMLFMFKAEGIGQKVTAGIMTVLDMLGEFTLFTFDTLYQSGKAGMTSGLSADEVRMVVLGLSALVALNILATVIFHLLEPENLKRMRESFVKDQLESAALKEIEKRGEEIAARLAPRLAEQWALEFESRFADMRALGLGNVQTAEQKPKSMVDIPEVKEREAAELQPVPLHPQGFSSNGHSPNGHK